MCKCKVEIEIFSELELIFKLKLSLKFRFWRLKIESFFSCPSLPPHTPCFWKVAVWDGMGRLTDEFFRVGVNFQIKIEFKIYNFEFVSL